MTISPSMQDPNAWPWDPSSLVVDKAINWHQAPVTAMASLNNRIIKKLKREDLQRLLTDPSLKFLRDHIQPVVIESIGNVLAGKPPITVPSTIRANSLSGSQAISSVTSPQAPSAPSDQSCPMSSSGSSPVDLSPSSSGTLSTNTPNTPNTPNTTNTNIPNTHSRLLIERPEDVLAALEAIARNAETDGEYSAQIQAYKLIGEQLAMFQKNKPQDPVITINVVSGVQRS